MSAEDASLRLAQRAIKDLAEVVAELKFKTPLMMAAVRAAENESCARLVEQMGAEGYGTLAIAAALRQRNPYNPDDRRVH
jgi:hypothetical protein